MRRAASRDAARTHRLRTLRSLPPTPGARRFRRCGRTRRTRAVLASGAAPCWRPSAPSPRSRVSWLLLSVEGPPDGLAQDSQAGGHVGAQVDAERAAVALRQDLEIAARLRRLDDPERVLLPRHRQIDG